MYEKKMEEDIRCPLEYALQIFGGKWKSRIICVLSEKGTLRYSELRGEMINITDAVLTSTLKELARDGLVDRTSYNEIPPRVEYCLTDKGLSVVPILQTICKWAGAYHNEVTDRSLKQCQRCDYTDYHA
ncbi:MAG: winged helix-turn-helix transcriptional regulator [Saccharofermentanales bacterium]|jgi:DNA-binding HxlR family transcriptional regulator